MLPPDLEERFRRLYAAIGETFSRDPDDYVRVTERKVGKLTTHRVTFDGGRSPEQLKNDGGVSGHGPGPLYIGFGRTAHCSNAFY